MKYIGAGVFLRDKVHVSDVYTCIEASRHASTVKGWLKLHYVKRIVSALTGRRAWFWQVGLVNRLMQAAGFNSEHSAGDAEDAKAKLDKVCAWIGARLNMTMERVASELSVDEIQPTVYAIVKRDLERNLDMIKAQHLPEKFSKEILDEMRKLSQEVTATNKEVKQIKQDLDRYGRSKRTFTAGMLQPC